MSTYEEFLEETGTVPFYPDDKTLTHDVYCSHFIRPLVPKCWITSPKRVVEIAQEPN
jgi:hypothetical protein